ncbi:MAG: glycoside hydrolase family 2 protein [Thermanaerothrix sp.]|uniref:glycoside hydrolase family 2 protein n=1 Tax=Thermanaerothrix sp. TaxID=2972675 RepID=UPI003C7D4073
MVWQRQRAPLMTRWSEALCPDCVWPEYPHPQLVREDWLNLNGVWQFGIAPRAQAVPPAFKGEILVPFPIESALSGVMRPLQPEERLWYRRMFTVPTAWEGKRVLLHFGAVDWEAEVWVNGQRVGKHQGGYLPFTFDITPYLHPGEQELVVAVWDPTDAHWQQRGKQVRHPHSIWYTQVSGIWQTVWLEAVPSRYIAGLRITPDLAAQAVRVKVLAGGSDILRDIHVEVWAEGMRHGEASLSSSEGELVISLPSPRLWHPDSPFLYDLVVTAEEDRVSSYFGLREFRLGKDIHGRTRVFLNDEPLFMFGPLDQGYWPDGLYTPPSEEAMEWELKLLKQLGFNMLRKHVKVEPARYYYACDRLGLIVWQDMPNGGRAQTGFEGLVTLFLGVHQDDRRALWRFGRKSPDSRADYQRELKALVDHLYHFPCIGVWVPFNEGWGQFEARAIAEWLKAYDPTRLVDHASGWYDQGGGDFASYHIYGKPLKPIPPTATRAVVLSEFGGYSLEICNHLWNPRQRFGYKHFQTIPDLTAAYERLLDEQLRPWVEAGLSAAIYTQTTDVEIEVNGYMTYDRAVLKMDAERLRAVHKRLMTKADPGL